ncbi:MAG: hypothetical protein QOF53_1492 [Nocardioidaceae bacterium]|nr:hypothetical protein [Nocardioidaceae bacterium]
MSVPWAVIREERTALIELLETLNPEEWATPSLCAGWTVQDVASHLAWAPAAPATEVLGDLLRARLRPNRLNADSAVRHSARGTDAILEQLRENAVRDAKPIGVPQNAVLVDAVVHAVDIRRPLDRPRAIPPEAFAPAARFCARTRWPASLMIGGNVRARIRGLRLVADDLDWAWGDGPEVHGSGEALMLVLTGRAVGAGELSGPGAATLARRL